MPDLDLILQVEQGMRTFGCRGKSTSVCFIIPEFPPRRARGVSTAMKTASAPSIAGMRSVAKVSRPAAVLAATKPPRSGS